MRSYARLAALLLTVSSRHPQLFGATTSPSVTFDNFDRETYERRVAEALQSLERIQDRLQEARQQRLRTVVTLQDLESQLSRLAQELQDLERDAQTLARVKGELEQERSQIQDEERFLWQKRVWLHMDVAILRGRPDDKEDDLEKAEEALSSEKSKLQERERQACAARQRFERSESAEGSPENEVDALRQALRSAEEAVRSQEKAVTQSEADVNNARREYREAKESLEATEAQVNRVTATLDSGASRVTEIENRLRDIDLSIQDTRARARQREADRSGTMPVKDQARERLSQLEQWVSTLESELAVATARLQQEQAHHDPGPHRRRGIAEEARTTQDESRVEERARESEHPAGR